MSEPVIMPGMMPWAPRGGEMAPGEKNQRGQRGPICGYCGGYGFTNSVLASGASSGCNRCHGTGVEPPDVYAMAGRLDAIEREMGALRETGQQILALLRANKNGA